MSEGVSPEVNTRPDVSTKVEKSQQPKIETGNKGVFDVISKGRVKESIGKPVNASQPESNIQNEAELKRIINEKMCVLRSLTSVARAFTREEVGLDSQMVMSRLEQTKEIETKAANQYEDAIQEWTRTGRMPDLLSQFKIIDQLSTEVLSEDKENVRRLINTVLVDKEDRSSLEQGLRGTMARYDTAFDLSPVISTLKNPNNQVCIIFPRHMAHVALNEKGEIVSLSDPADASGNPVPIDMLTFLSSIRKSGRENMIVFTKVEKFNEKDFDRIDDNFLQPSKDDPDYQHVINHVSSLGDQPLYPPKMGGEFMDRVYPEITTYRDKNRWRDVYEAGPLRKEEAIATEYLLRKIVILDRVAQGDAESNVDSEFNNLFAKEAAKAGLKDVRSHFGSADTINGMNNFISYIREATLTREDMKNETKSQDKKKVSIRDRLPFLKKKPTFAEQTEAGFSKERMELFGKSLEADGNLIGDKTTGVMVNKLREGYDSSPKMFGDETTERVADINLGIDIARKFYLESLKIA